MFSPEFIKKRDALRKLQAERDAARAAEQPLAPTGLTYEQSRLNRLAREETTRSIQDEVRQLSDRQPVDPIQARRDDLAQKLKWAAGSEKMALRERINVLDIHLKKTADEAAEMKRREDFAAHPAVINARTAADTMRSAATLYPDVPPEAIQKILTIASSPDFSDPLHMSRCLYGALSEVEDLQFAADERKHTEALTLTAQNFSVLNAAEAASLASKARLDAARKNLGADDVQQDSE